MITMLLLLLLLVLLQYAPAVLPAFLTIASSSLILPLVLAVLFSCSTGERSIDPTGGPESAVPQGPDASVLQAAPDLAARLQRAQPLFPLPGRGEHHRASPRVRFRPVASAHKYMKSSGAVVLNIIEHGVEHAGYLGGDTVHQCTQTGGRTCCKPHRID